MEEEMHVPYRSKLTFHEGYVCDETFMVNVVRHIACVAYLKE